MTYHVYVSDRPKGTVERERGRYVWFRPNGGKEVYTRKHRLADVRAHIGFVCLTPDVRVELEKEKR